MRNCPFGFSCADMMQTPGLTAEGCENRERCLADNCYNLGITQEQWQRLEEEVDFYEQELELNPDDSWVWDSLGWALTDLGRYEQAVASYKKSLELEPDNWWTWEHLGDALMDLGRDEEAIASYKKSLELEPDNWWTWDSLGDALMDLGRDEEAIASYKKSLELEPDNWWTWDSLGDALIILARYKQAVAAYKKSLELNQENLWAQRGIYDALMALGRYEEAIEYSNKTIVVYGVVARLPNQFQRADVERACPTVSKSKIKRILARMRKSSYILCIKRGRDAVWEKTQESSWLSLLYEETRLFDLR